MLKIWDFNDLGLPIGLPRPIRVNSARTVAEGSFRPTIASKDLSEEMTEITGMDSEELSLSTRIFELDLWENDQVIVQASESGLPFIIRRDGEVIVNFDIRAIQSFYFADSKRPIYTYILGFKIQKIPTIIRRPLSDFVQEDGSILRTPRGFDKMV